MKFQAKNIGREFVRRYYTILNRSPENLHCFYNDDAKFVHDDVDVRKSKTISVVGKAAIREAVLARLLRHRHRCTIVDGVDTIETINNGLVVKVFGEIAYGAEEMRPFDQTFILGAASSVQFYIYNEIFRYRDVSSAQHSPLIATSENRQPAAGGDDVAALNLEQMNEMQTQHLKSILQDASRAASTQIPTSKLKAAPQSNHISERTNKLFQDKCIITIGNVLNPNIEFDESSGSDAAVTDPDSGGELVAKAPDDTQRPLVTAERKSTYAESLKFVSKERRDPVSSSSAEKVNIPPAEAEKEVEKHDEGETESASIGWPSQSNVKPNKNVSEISPPKIGEIYRHICAHFREEKSFSPHTRFLQIHRPRPTRIFYKFSSETFPKRRPRVNYAAFSPSSARYRVSASTPIRRKPIDPITRSLRTSTSTASASVWPTG